MNKIVQVIIAIIVALVVNLFATWIMKSDDVPENVMARRNIVIIPGFVSTKSFLNKKFDTYNPFMDNYIKLHKSINRQGGAQFSYSFWLRLDDMSSNNVSNKVLFLRGDNQKYIYKKMTTRAEKGEAYATQTMDTYNDYVTKCPLIKFGDSANELIVEMNTNYDINSTVKIQGIRSTDDEAVRRNMMSLMPSKWVLLSFTFEDNKVYDEHERGIRVQFFFNDVLFHTQKVRGTLNVNEGDFVILPESINEGSMGNLTYHNYALNIDDVSRLLLKGPPTQRYEDLKLKKDKRFNEPLYLTEYNKLEIYNM